MEKNDRTQKELIEDALWILRQNSNREKLTCMNQRQLIEVCTICQEMLEAEVTGARVFINRLRKVCGRISGNIGRPLGGKPAPESVFPDNTPKSMGK